MWPLRTILPVLLTLTLGAFFAFVGWNKAFASMADLARHEAWTIHLPEWLGRLVGWSEMALAAGLLAGFFPRRSCTVRIASILLVANQLAAAAVHLT